MKTTLYNPANKRKEQLIEEFVIRTKIFDSIIKDVKSSSDKYPGQHYLLVGQRGSGKTTLIYRIKYAIEDDKTLKHIIPLSLGEEQYGITELVNLWEKISEILEDYYGFDNLYDDVQAELHKPNYEEKCFNILIERLSDQKKKLILFIDNFGDLLKKLDEIEIHRLREILITCTSLRLIAASPVLIDEIFDYQKPLFEFFKTVPLKGLSNEEIESLLLKLAELNHSTEKIKTILKNDPERVQVLRILTGGITRTIVLLYNIFVDNVDGTSIKDLQLTLDAVTPLYKHKMDDLPKNQQKIVDAVAKSWDATSVKEISKTTRIESKIISAQLRNLEKNQLIEKINTGKKNHLYQIKERFFNIWYLMRYGRKYDRKRVIWLVRFLESWCTKEELESRISSHIHSLKNGQFDDEAAILLGEAYLGCKKIDLDLKRKLILESKEIFPESLTKGMSISDTELLNTAFEHYSDGRYEDAIQNALEIGNKEMIYGFLANSYYQIDDYDNALKFSDKLLENGDADDADYGIRGSIFHMLDEYPQAIESLETAVSVGSREALSELGFLYLKTNEYDLAEKNFLESLKYDKENDRTLHLLGHLYEITNSKKDAEKYFLDAIKKGSDRARFCLARFYDKNDDYDKAIEFYKSAFEFYPEESSIGLIYLYLQNEDSKENLEEAIQLIDKIKNSVDEDIQYSLAMIYDKFLNNLKKSKAHFKRAAKLGHDDAFHKLAHLYQRTDDFEKAEEYFLKSFEVYDDYHALLCLANLYYENNKSNEKALLHIEHARKLMELDFDDEIFYATVLLSNNDLEKSVKIIEKIINNFEDITTNYKQNDDDDDDEIIEMSGIIEYFVELMSHEYYDAAHSLLIKNEMGDILKPLYFALMNFMKKDFPDEYLKAGEEIKEIVDEIVSDVNNRRDSRLK